jgi:2-C-methyl-D-erythritol 2,4-cyclodiphosphate synthase
MRVGIGFDSHNLVPRRKLVLGGVEIPFDRGLEGHSDADVLIHAVIDALLGAACLGNIGDHFPDTDGRYREIASTKLLVETMEKVRHVGFGVVNVDSVIIAERPKLSPYMETMRKTVAQTMNVPHDRLSIKAKTTEGKDATGRGEAIAAYAVVLLDESG